MKIVVKSNEITEMETKLLEYINNINEEIEKIKNLKEDLIWLGISYDAFTEKFDEIIVESKKKMLKLETFTKFLDEVLLNYGVAIEDIEEEFKKNLKDFNSEVRPQ